MGSLWRSEHMEMVHLFTQADVAHDTVDELAKLGAIQFKDLNWKVNVFSRHFVENVRRVGELERKLSYFDSLMQSTSIKPPAIEPEDMFKAENAVNIRLSDMETQFEDLERVLNDLGRNEKMLRRDLEEVTDLRLVLLHAADVLKARGDVVIPNNDDAEMGGKSVKLGYICGMINAKVATAFERILWRSLRGNMFIRMSDLLFPAVSGAPALKSTGKFAFVIFFQGTQSENRIKKICDAVGASTFTIPDSDKEITAMLNACDTKVGELEEILKESTSQTEQILGNICFSMNGWRAKLFREKVIYNTLNLFNYDVGRKCLIGLGWCTRASIPLIEAALKRASDRNGALAPSVLTIVETKDTPPTHFVTNNVTGPFLTLVEAYGIARYREISPVPFTIVTFPFMFGVMFGDFGHGWFLLALAILMVWKEKQLAPKLTDESMRMIFGARWLIMFMSLFAIYMGLLYCDAFSFGINIFGTQWKCNDEIDCPWGQDPKWTGYLVPFGFDPAWKGVNNELEMYNSFKMKLSMILAVFHMSLGVILSGMNAIHFKKPLDFIFGFLPQLVFFWGLFGYLVFMIYYKWLFWSLASAVPPPKLLTIMINMFLSPSSCCKPGIDYLYDGQAAIQTIILLLVVISVPMMLFGKPLSMFIQSKMNKNHSPVQIHEEDSHSKAENGEDGEAPTDHNSIGEVLIHCLIHTIEYVLGAISNTASYLRLWALSLAHSQLAEVFQQQILEGQLASGNAFLVFAAVSGFAGATAAVLLGMEALSAFLHSLRLHWVEFQSKFYAGDGYKFLPLNYVQLFKQQKGEE